MTFLVYKRLLLLVPLSLAPLLYLAVSRAKSLRQRLVPSAQERVLILGASSGIGREIARLYASRNAYVCIVGRREDKLDAVRSECVQLCPSPGANKILKLSEDFSNPDGLLRVRDLLVDEWRGLDTLIVSAGVSSLQPLLAVAGIPRDDPFRPADAPGLARVRDVAAAAVSGNFTGPLLSAVTFIPLLAQSSRRPAVLLVSSIAAVIPAPTRTLYAASKAAALALFQALAIEHPAVAFTSVLPATVEGDFRASAVDGGAVRERLTKSLKQERVAKACVRAVDVGQRTLWLPPAYEFFHLLYWIVPSVIIDAACKKYNFKS